MSKKASGADAQRGKPPIVYLELPLPPGINTQYATVEGKRVLSETARKWKRQVERYIGLLEEQNTITDEVLSTLGRQHLSVFMEFFFSSPHRRDLDGGLKIALDAVCEALNLNDNRVVEIHLVKRIDPLHPRLEVTLEGVSNWEFDEQFVLIQDKNETNGQEN
jgi:crossover junction endodeoxyribonuclease RusA